MAATGGAAAVKTPFVLRRLRDAGHLVRAAATEDAYRFVTPLSLSLAAGGEVLDRQNWFDPHGRALHLEWAAWADLLLIAPATAEALANGAHGHAHDVVSALVVAGVARVAWAPAMNGEMWKQPAVRRNVEQLRADGHAIIGPGQGAMATVGEREGPGRMLEPEELVRRLDELFTGVPERVPEGDRNRDAGEQPVRSRSTDLAGRRVLVSAGPTREYLDPVRFLSNPSSGKMGYAVAAAAAARGARVTLVSGPTSLLAPAGVEVRQVTTAEEMLAALSREFDGSDVLVMTAAVADWRAATPARRKEPKSGSRLSLELVRTPDILELLADQRSEQVVVGFAMETDEGVERAADKARRKRLDFICLNYPTHAGSGFGGEENEVTIVTADGTSEPLPRMAKSELADTVLDRIVELLSDPSGGDDHTGEGTTTNGAAASVEDGNY
ncbi:MAG: bifunctional phosphopantothenoylcysteine decarboxylase/phosphopantothenate synthase [Trueperaceae bacterium]